MSNHLVKDILSLEPKNWQDLADATTFLRGLYSDFLATALTVVTRILNSRETKTTDIVEFNFGLQQIALNGELAAYANCIRLGAKSASIENKSGNFNGREQIIYRASDAVHAGKLIENFVNCARTLTATSILQKEGLSERGVLDAQDMAASEIFDRTQKILEVQAKAGVDPRLYPQVETIVRIVKDEIGLLPLSIRQSIIDAMNFKPT